jgi:TRAP transporter 4TM/12TM fusion protein
MNQPESDAIPASAAIRGLSAGLGAAVTLGSLAWAADLFRAFGVNLYNEQFFAGMLAVSIALVFVVFPARRGAARATLPWYDALAGLAGVAASVWTAVYYERIFENLTEFPVDGVITSSVIIVCVAEGLRRSAGPVLFAFLLCFIGFGLIGHHIPGQLQGEDVSLQELVIYLGIDSNGLFGIAMRVSTTIVVAFVFFGNLLRPAGGGDFFTEISTALMGRYRGGSAKIAIVASSLFGSISGSAVSNVVSTGVITIPLMRRAGYAAHSAAAIEAVASTGGQLMPPMMGAAAFVMAEFLQIQYSEVVLAALIPAVLYYFALFIQTDLQSARDGIARVEEALIPRVWPVARAGWYFLIPFVVIIVALFRYNLSPETSALYAAVSLIPIGVLLGYKGRRMPLRAVARTVSETGVGVVEIIMIGATAGMIIGVLNITGLGFALTLALVKFAFGSLPLLLVLAALVCIVLGMGMPTLGVYILLAALVAPSIVELGVGEISAHLFVMYFGMMSMLTPPVAIAAFAAASVAGADAMRTGFAAMKCGWLAYVVPFLFVVSPALLMHGSVAEVALAFVTALAGVWLVSVGMVGYFRRPLDLLNRSGFVVAGLAMLIPDSAVHWGIWTDIGGALVGALLVTRECMATRRSTVTG